jgi:hypothetical protein
VAVVGGRLDGLGRAARATTGEALNHSRVQPALVSLRRRSNVPFASSNAK